MIEQTNNPPSQDVADSERSGDRRPSTCSRFFIAEPGDWTVPHPDIAWTKWEVGDHRGQDRICLTSCKRKAELIRDAMEAFHENVKSAPTDDNEQSYEKETEK